MPRRRQYQRKTQSVVAPVSAWRATFASSEDLRLRRRVARCESVQLVEVDLGLGGAKNNRAVVGTPNPLPASQLLVCAQPASIASATLAAATFVRPVVKLPLPIRCHLVLRDPAFLRDINRGNVPRKFLRVHQFYRTFMGLDTLQDHRQSDACAGDLSALFAATLEKCLENPRAFFFRYAGPGVTKLETKLLPDSYARIVI